MLNRSADKRTLNGYQAPLNDKKQYLENIKPDANDYKQLHDKLNYLETKITEMKSNLDKKREEKKKYFEKEARERKDVGDNGRNQDPASKADPLKELVSQVSYEKKLKPMAFDPYSPRHNVYYVSEIVRAYKEENSLPR